MPQSHPCFLLAFGIVILLSPVRAQTYEANAEACSLDYANRFCFPNDQVCCYSPDTCLEGTTTCLSTSGSDFPPGKPGQPGPGPLPSPPISSSVTLPVLPPSPLPVPPTSGGVPMPGGGLVVPTPVTSLSVSVPSFSVPVPSTTVLPSTATTIPTTAPLPVGPAPTPNKGGGGGIFAANLTSGTNGSSNSMETGPVIFTGAAAPSSMKGLGWLMMRVLSVITVGVGILI